MTTTTLMQNLALANAAGDLRDALEGILQIARPVRDGLLRETITGDDISIGQRLLNYQLVRHAARWNDAIEAGEKAIMKAGA